MLNLFGLNNMNSQPRFFFRFAGVIHWLAAIAYIFLSPLFIFGGLFNSDGYALIMFFLPLIGGILFAIQGGLLGNVQKKSILFAAILVIYFLVFLLFEPRLDIVPHVGLGISAVTLLYLLINQSKIKFNS